MVENRGLIVQGDRLDLARLQQLAAMGATVNPEEDPAFSELSSLPAFAQVSEQLAANRRPRPAAGQPRA